MRNLLLAALLLLMSTLPARADTPVRLLIHGGAGTIDRNKITAEIARDYNAALAGALKAGHAVLAAGGSSVEAVVAAIVVMEDSPLFNAGKGAVFTHAGRNELDASIMDGSTRAAAEATRAEIAAIGGDGGPWTAIYGETEQPVKGD